MYANLYMGKEAIQSEDWRLIILMRFLTLLIAVFLIFPGNAKALAQHEDHMESMPGMQGSTAPPTDMRSPIGIPESRQGSGTSWLPDSTPMYAVHDQSDKWSFMYHGAAHMAYDKMNGPRGDTKLMLPNWTMLMARRNVGARNMWRLSGMISLDPITVGGSGYPLLFQTGETWQGQPLIDHQHPHNFFTELSATYTHALTPDSAIYAYLAPVGEPALGPVAYMHRTIGLDDPLAPIGHHWQDATHITFGVVTLGYQTRKWQYEISTFNGREPGENRYEIERPEFDSLSTRFSYNPNSALAAQVSYAFLKSPEALHPEENTHRTTASVIYNRPINLRSNFQSTFVWGRNRISGINLDSYLIEAQLKNDGGWTPFFRYEHSRKDAQELVLPASFSPDQAFGLRQTTLGIVRDIPSKGNLVFGAGGQLIFNSVPDELKGVYGDNPRGWLIFVRVHPKRHSMTMP